MALNQRQIEKVQEMIDGSIKISEQRAKEEIDKEVAKSILASKEQFAIQTQLALEEFTSREDASKTRMAELKGEIEQSCPTSRCSSPRGTRRPRRSTRRS